MLIGADPSAEDAAIFAERLQASIGEPCRMNGREATVSSSIGIALYPEQGPISALIANAEAAMRSAKSGGGAGYAFFEQRMTSGARDQLDLLRDLRRALSDGQLHLVYQPKIHAPSGEITGAEALMRWEHPTARHGRPGPVHPDRRALRADRRDGQLADRGGVPPGRACGATQACRCASRSTSRRTSCATPTSPTASTWRCATTHQAAAAHLRDHRVGGDGRRVDAIRMVERLKQIGVNISIDDFGTGYSSLSYLESSVPASSRSTRASSSTSRPAPTRARSSTASSSSPTRSA